MSTSGYTRQSSGQIVDTLVITASCFNNEYNALASFADATNGHNHDGTVGAGQKIPTAGLVGLTSTSSGIVKASGSNTFTAAALATSDIANGAITYAKIQNETNNTLLGNSSGGAAAPSEQTIGATLAFSGSALQTAAITGDITSSANSFVTTVAKIQGTSVTGTTGSGNVVLATSPTITGATISSAAATLTGGTINNMIIGGSTPVAGHFTTLSTTGLATLSSLTTASATITGGAIDNADIGDFTPAAGTFTNLTATNVTFTGGHINNTIIGNITPVAGTFGDFAAGADATNKVTILGGTAGNAPVITFTGGDANVSGIFNTKGSSSLYTFKIASAAVLQIGGNASNVNTLSIAGANTGLNPAFSFQGEATVGGTIYTAGTGNITFQTQNTSATQLRILHTASANRFITITGSNGGSPTLSTSAGDVTLNSSTGNVLSNTPTALDSSTKVATTAFVKTSGLTFSALTPLGVNTSLSTADLGSVIDITAASITITLPAVASCPAGTAVAFVSDTGVAGSWTLKGNAAETIVRAGAAGANTVSIANPTSITAISTTTKWIVYG